MEKQIEIRDNRRRQMFRMDDEYLDGGYSKSCGPAATCIYMSLCRHADTRQECWPSVEAIGGQHGMSKSTVLRAIRVLEKHGIIFVDRRKNEKTKRQMVNVYVLVDQSQWNGSRVSGENPEPSVTMIPGPGVKSDQKPGVTRAPEGYTEEKVTQREGSAAQSAAASMCMKAGEGCTKQRMKGVEFCEEHQPMSCQQFIVWYRKSEQRHIRIIAEFADELRLSGKNPDFRTVAQWREWAGGRMKKWASELVVFDDDQLGAAMKRMMSADYVTDFNLNTLKTFLFNAKK